MKYEIHNGETVINTIVADAEFMQANFPEGNYRLVAEPEPEPTPEVRHITVGAFFDRFGSEKYAILSSDDALVKAMVTDASVRKFIDLDRPDLLTGLQMIAAKGFDIDPQAIVSAEIQPHERP
jgi:hypothetical protein